MKKYAVNYYFCNKTRNALEIMFKQMTGIFGNKFFPKSILGFQFWTFIFVHFPKPILLFEFFL